jgi:transposase
MLCIQISGKCKCGRPRTTVPYADGQEMARLYRGGMSIEHVAARTGYGKTVVRRSLTAMGVPIRTGRQRGSVLAERWQRTGSLSAPA